MLHLVAGVVDGRGQPRVRLVDGGGHLVERLIQLRLNGVDGVGGPGALATNGLLHDRVLEYLARA